MMVERLVPSIHPIPQPSNGDASPAAAAASNAPRKDRNQFVPPPLSFSLSPGSYCFFYESKYDVDTQAAGHNREAPGKHTGRKAERKSCSREIMERGGAPRR